MPFRFIYLSDKKSPVFYAELFEWFLLDYPVITVPSVLVTCAPIPEPVGVCNALS
jgi:hypothetical protein